MASVQVQAPAKRSFRERLGLKSAAGGGGRRLSKNKSSSGLVTLQSVQSQASTATSQSQASTQYSINNGFDDDSTLCARDSMSLEEQRSASLSQQTTRASSVSTESQRTVRTTLAGSRARKRLQKANDFHTEIIDRNTGERKDITDMMHAMGFDDTPQVIMDYRISEEVEIDPERPRGEPMLTKLSAELWVHITDYLLPREAANLAMTCKTALDLLGTRPFENLRLEHNIQERVNFLLLMDSKMPNQLFCHVCASYHTRTNPGKESLKPAHVINPLFNCPNRTNMLKPAHRHRLACGRTLPFHFIQLVTRAFHYGLPYGIHPDSLSRRWNDPWSDWTHQSRYYVHKNGHLLMRVVSQVFADGGLCIASKRMLLYNRDDYMPYFSVCAHWRDGILMDLTKCALDHIPTPKDRTAYLGGPQSVGPKIVTMCGECQPMRRCTMCPTEYLIELKLVEDKSVAMSNPLRFRQALVVTRWSDLGSGRDPATSLEWQAVQGEREDYNSIIEVGGRSVSATFESAFTDSFPYQRLLSLNPKGTKYSEDSSKWY